MTCKCSAHDTSGQQALILLSSVFFFFFFSFQPKATRAGDEKHRKKKAHGLNKVENSNVWTQFLKIEHSDPLILVYFLNACAINNIFWQNNWHILFDQKLSRATLSAFFLHHNTVKCHRLTKWCWVVLCLVRFGLESEPLVTCTIVCPTLSHFHDELIAPLGRRPRGSTDEYSLFTYFGSSNFSWFLLYKA